jgi:hypothetical protein
MKMKITSPNGTTHSGTTYDWSENLKLIASLLKAQDTAVNPPIDVVKVTIDFADGGILSYELEDG